MSGSTGEAPGAPCLPPLSRRDKIKEALIQELAFELGEERVLRATYAIDRWLYFTGGLDKVKKQVLLAAGRFPVFHSRKIKNYINNHGNSSSRTPRDLSSRKIAQVLKQLEWKGLIEYYGGGKQGLKKYRLTGRGKKVLEELHD